MCDIPIIHFLDHSSLQTWQQYHWQGADSSHFIETWLNSYFYSNDVSACPLLSLFKTKSCLECHLTVYSFITFLSVLVFYCGTISVLVLRHLVLWHHHSTHFFLSISPVKLLQPCTSPHFSECLVKLCTLDVSFQIVNIFLSGLSPSPFSNLPIYCPCIADFYSLCLWIELSP